MLLLAKPWCGGRKRALRITASLITGVSLVLWLFLWTPNVWAQGTTPKYVLGVMPFLNVTKNPAYEWLSTGIAETLTNRLSGVKAIRILERSRINEVLTEQKLGLSGFVDPATAAPAGKLLGAEKLIIGSYQIMRDDLLIQARIVDVETGAATDPSEASGPIENVLSYHYGVLSQEVIRILGGISLTTAETKRLTTPETESLSAYELYTKAIIILTGGIVGELVRRDIPREELLEVIEYLEKATEIDPNYAEAYNGWGIALNNLRSHEEAIDKFKKVIELDPDNLFAYNNWGTALLKLDRHEEAIEKFKRATEIDPNSALAYNNWGLALTGLDKPEEAIKKHKKALEINPNYANAYLGWGLALAMLKRYEEATEKYRRTTEWDPNDALAYNNWGWALNGLGKFEDAIPKFKRGLEIDPSDAMAYYGWGLALMALGKSDESIEKYKKALEVNPNLAAAYYGWGLTLWFYGSKDEAKEKFRKAKELGYDVPKEYLK